MPPWQTPPRCLPNIKRYNQPIGRLNRTTKPARLVPLVVPSNARRPPLRTGGTLTAPIRQTTTGCHSQRTGKNSNTDGQSRSVDGILCQSEHIHTEGQDGREPCWFDDHFDKATYDVGHSTTTHNRGGFAPRGNIVRSNLGQKDRNNMCVQETRSSFPEVVRHRRCRPIPTSCKREDKPVFGWVNGQFQQLESKVGQYDETNKIFRRGKQQFAGQNILSEFPEDSHDHQTDHDGLLKTYYDETSSSVHEDVRETRQLYCDNVASGRNKNRRVFGNKRTSGCHVDFDAGETTSSDTLVRDKIDYPIEETNNHDKQSRSHSSEDADALKNSLVYGGCFRGPEAGHGDINQSKNKATFASHDDPGSIDSRKISQKNDHTLPVFSSNESRSSLVTHPHDRSRDSSLASQSRMMSNVRSIKFSSAESHRSSLDPSGFDVSLVDSQRDTSDIDRQKPKERLTCPSVISKIEQLSTNYHNIKYLMSNNFLDSNVPSFNILQERGSNKEQRELRNQFRQVMKIANDERRSNDTGEQRTQKAKTSGFKASIVKVTLTNFVRPMSLEIEDFWNVLKADPFANGCNKLKQFTFTKSRLPFYEHCIITRPQFYTQRMYNEDTRNHNKETFAFSGELGASNGEAVLTLCHYDEELICLPYKFSFEDCPYSTLRIQWRLLHHGPSPSLQMAFLLLNRVSSLLCLVRISANSACAVFSNMIEAERAMVNMNPLIKPRLLIGDWWSVKCRLASFRHKHYFEEGRETAMHWVNQRLLAGLRRSSGIKRLSMKPGKNMIKDINSQLPQIGKLEDDRHSNDTLHVT